jgi:glycosyltransferase involved in cell wall biosynthesis
LKILFVARSYPPLVGGMEQFSKDFFNNIIKFANVDLIANYRGKRNTLVFFIKVCIRFIFTSNKYQIIHFSDAILAPAIPIIRLFSNAKISFTVHGLDIIYSKYGYQKIIIPFLKQADVIFAVSSFTKAQCIHRGITNNKIIVIPNGIDFSKIKHNNTEKIAIPLIEKIRANKENIILFSIGRLIKRKGHLWFIEKVFRFLPDNYYYIISGNGPEYIAITKQIEKFNLSEKIILTGRVTTEEKISLYKFSDLFIMPNIIIKNDQEGFGIVILEAGAFGLPVIASKVEGIIDAVIDNKTGILIEEKNANNFQKEIISAKFNSKEIIEIVTNNFNWDKIAQKYIEEFKNILEQ